MAAEDKCDLCEKDSAVDLRLFRRYLPGAARIIRTNLRTPYTILAGRVCAPPREVRGEMVTATAVLRRRSSEGQRRDGRR